MFLLQLLEILISGVTIGLVYFLIAVGFSLIYGVSRVLVYSYGSFFTWGAYFAWIFAVGVLKLPYAVVFVIVIPMMVGLGILLERAVIRPLRHRPAFDWNVLLATLGVALFLDNLALVVFGARTKSLPSMLEGTLRLGSIVVSLQQITMLLLAGALALGLTVLLNRTRLGMSMRAVAQDEAGARIVGVNINRIYAYTFGISAALSGVGGILLAPRFYISPLGGWDFLVKALIIVIAGGLGSIKGTLYAAFILGILEAFVGWRLGLLWVLPFWFVVLLIILLIRPQGLFGKGKRI
jgi:branched-chain amino acid transport system permease protein